MTTRRVLAGAALAVTMLAAAPGDLPKAPPSIAKERRDKETYFRDNPWSPLRAFARYDFAPAEAGKPEPNAVVGSAADAAIRFDAPGIAPRQLRITVLPPPAADRPARFRLDRLAKGAVIRIGGETWPEPAAPPAADSRTVDEETVIEIGPFALRPYVQADAGILIEFDRRRTEGAAFIAPVWYDADPAWVFEAPLRRYEKPETRSLLTSLNRRKEYLAVGWFDLKRPDGAPLKVQVYEPTFLANGADHLSILFTDETTGRETYGAGRYLDLAPPRDGLYTVDFNRAYNPLCAYTPVYNCPIPPRENALPVPVRAGEKIWPGHAPH
ncbi:MAG TPA: DUF1684 domain-containing protein [Dongiaceae bacterium]|nr:DUF1684 domain-containing protein [Dongiaceae bacterium]